jgi:Predicted nucleotide-binding protein containing TIR-like domain
MSFGNQIRSLSKAVDIVTNDIKDNILNIIKEKLKESLGIEFITLHVETIVDNYPGLSTTSWYIGGSKMGANSLKTPEGAYRTQVALAFALNRPLWIVCSEGKADLSICSHYVDLWSGTESNLIPNYFKNSDSLSKTSIILPLTRSNEDKPYAVINFESVKYLECSTALKNEIRNVAESISRLYQRNLSHLHQVNDTQDEIQELRNIKVYDLSKKTSLFFAFSGRADEDVVNTIQELFHEDEYKNLDLKRWDRDESTGMIQGKILSDIRDCQFGICYLSEPDGENKFRDNANVLIEVGMFWYKSEDFSNVILVREESSPTTPFDIGANRILSVPRETGTNQIRVSKFKANFQKMLNKMLGL